MRYSKVSFLFSKLKSFKVLVHRDFAIYFCFPGILRFNGTDMLERLKGKRVVIVGDSTNRNQWESLVCLLYSSVPSSETHVNVTSSTWKIFLTKIRGRC